MAIKKVVRIDALPESAWRYVGYDAIVCIDVLLSSTTIVTALAQGRRVFAAPTTTHAAWFKSRSKDAHVLTDSPDHAGPGLALSGPASLAAAEGQVRDVVHVTPFAEMLAAAMPRSAVHVACLRNLEATAAELAARHLRIAILGAGDAGEVSTEDQMAAAWLAVRLRARGYEIEGHNTENEVERWGTPDVSLVGWSRSAERLRAHGRAEDVDFVLAHYDDLEVVAAYAGGEVRDPAAHRRRARAEEDDLPTPAWGTPLPVLGQ
jgi:phosphosulfolactate phosphohydrolase-like enzyme